MYNVRVIEIEKKEKPSYNMFKKFASVALSSIFMAGAMMAANSGNNSADAQSYTSNYNWRYAADYNCSGGKVYVNTSHAWLKSGPSLSYPTIRTAGWNTALWVAKDMGWGHNRYGWIPVKTADNARLWVHHSRVGCTAGQKWGYNTTNYNWNTKNAWSNNYHWKHGAYWNRHAYWDRHMCNRVRVAAPYAWLKKYPSIKSRTLATAYHGEPLMRVGHHHKNGWWLYARQNGTRYWVHNSVLSCDTMMKTTAAPAPAATPKPAPTRNIKSCMDVLQCAADTANKATAGQYKQWMKQIKDMMSNPLTKLAGEELCKNTMEKPITDALPGCARN